MRDVIRAIVHIVEKNITGAYDLGTGIGYTARELFERWGEPLPPAAGPGSEYYPKGVPAELVARDLLPGFETKYDVLAYLDEMKQYGDLVY